MSALGRSRPINTPLAVAACPLRAESGQIAVSLGMSALCHFRTYAPQQGASSLD
jgi:hypothetical protein